MRGHLIYVVVLCEHLIASSIDSFDLHKEFTRTKISHSLKQGMIKLWYASYFRLLVVSFALLFRISLLQLLLFVLVDQSKSPRVNETLVNYLGAPIMRWVWNGHIYDILLEELLNVSYSSWNLILQKTSSNLSDNHLNKRR